MKRVINQRIVILELAMGRLRRYLAALILTLIGMIIAITLTISIPLYMDTTYSKLLAFSLDIPPYAFRFRYLGAWDGSISLEDVKSAQMALEQAFITEFPLPLQSVKRYTQIGTWDLVMDDGTALGGWTIGSTTETNIQITHGDWSNANTADGAIPVLIAENLIYEMGIQIGDHLIAERNGQEFPIEIVATWTPNGEPENTWTLQPRVFEQLFLVNEAGMERLTRNIQNPVNEVTWFHSYDGSELRVSEIDSFLADVDDAMLRVQTTLPKMRLDVSPAQNLRTVQENANRVLGQTFATLLPIYGVVFFFISLVSSMLVQQQQGEDRKLRMRGLNRRNILEIHLYMWLVISLLSFVPSVIVSPMLVSYVIGDSFRSITDYLLSLQSVMSPMTLLPGLLASLLASCFGLFYVYRQTDHNAHHIGDDTQPSRSTSIRGLEVILMLPALYVLWQHQRGEFASQSPFDNPIVFIAPSFLGVGLILLAIQLFLYILRLFEWSFRYTTSISALLALRELTRSPGKYFGTLFMIATTLCLMAYTASTASTYERNEFDNITYSVGGDMQLVTFVQAQLSSSTTEPGTSGSISGYILPPTEELDSIEGIEDYMRVGMYDARLKIGTRSLNGLVIGVDREALATVTHFRDDFSTEPIGNLGNQLALERSGLLLSQNVIDDFNLNTGQDLSYQIFAFDEWQAENRGRLAGVLSYFPTIDPNEYDFFFVTNLQTIFENIGTPLPYNIWLSLAPTISSTEIANQLRAARFPIMKSEAIDQQFLARKQNPEWQGTLGFLTIGLYSCIGLTIITSATQLASAFRRQAVQLGALRAIGLSSLSVLEYYLLLEGIIIGISTLSGLAVAAMVIALFIPLQRSANNVPPYIVQINWMDVFSGVAGVIALLVLSILIVSLSAIRTQLSQSIKLEQVE